MKKNNTNNNDTYCGGEHGQNFGETKLHPFLIKKKAGTVETVGKYSAAHSNTMSSSSSSHASAAPIIVIDNGSYEVRAGYPSDDRPRVAMPSIVGQPLNDGVAMATGVREYEVGFEARSKRGMLTCTEPVRAGVVQNWDAMEKLWAHIIFREMRVAPESFCFSISEPHNASKDQKEKTLELMMETFNAHSLYLGISSVFSLYSYGKTTGVAVDVGLHTTSAVPVHEGYCLTRQVTTSPVAGDAMTRYLISLLKEQGYGFGTSREHELINAVKEQLCYVMPSGAGGGLGNAFTSLHGGGAGDTTTSFLNGTAASASGLGGGNRGPAEFFLPDGQAIPLDNERHMCPETLFNFSILGREYTPRVKVFLDTGDEYSPSIEKGVSWLTYAAISNSEQALRNTLINSVVLAGGSSLFAGTRQRLQKELALFYREIRPNEAMIPISVSEVPCREHSAWLGGCMLSSISMFPHLTVSRAEYEEQGLRIIHRKNL